MDLDQLVEETSYAKNHRGRLFKRLVEFYPEFVQSYNRHRKGVKHEMTLHKKSYSRLVDIVKGIQRNRTSQTDGYVYCFFASESFHTVYMKIGRTHNIQERFQGYVGPMRPTQTVGTMYVHNQKLAERILIKEFTKRFKLDTREWFIVDDKARHEVRKAWIESCNLILASDGKRLSENESDAMSTDSNPPKTT